MKRNRVNKVFVVCPKDFDSTMGRGTGIEFWNIGYGAVGSELQTAHRRSESVIITTYQSATGFLERREKDLFDMLILDEAHKVRNLHGTPEPPKMATAIFRSLEARMFKYVVHVDGYADSKSTVGHLLSCRLLGPSLEGIRIHLGLPVNSLRGLSQMAKMLHVN